MLRLCLKSLPAIGYRRLVPDYLEPRNGLWYQNIFACTYRGYFYRFKSTKSGLFKSLSETVNSSNSKKIEREDVKLTDAKSIKFEEDKKLNKNKSAEQLNLGKVQPVTIKPAEIYHKNEKKYFKSEVKNRQVPSNKVQKVESNTLGASGDLFINFQELLTLPQRDLFKNDPKLNVRRSMVKESVKVAKKTSVKKLRNKYIPKPLAKNKKDPKIFENLSLLKESEPQCDFLDLQSGKKRILIGGMSDFSQNSSRTRLQNARTITSQADRGGIYKKSPRKKIDRLEKRLLLETPKIKAIKNRLSKLDRYWLIAAKKKRESKIPEAIMILRDRIRQQIEASKTFKYPVVMVDEPVKFAMATGEGSMGGDEGGFRRDDISARGVLEKVKIMNRKLKDAPYIPPIVDRKRADVKKSSGGKFHLKKMQKKKIEKVPEVKKIEEKPQGKLYSDKIREKIMKLEEKYKAQPEIVQNEVQDVQQVEAVSETTEKPPEILAEPPQIEKEEAKAEIPEPQPLQDVPAPVEHPKPKQKFPHYSHRIPVLARSTHHPWTIRPYRPEDSAQEVKPAITLTSAMEGFNLNSDVQRIILKAKAKAMGVQNVSEEEKKVIPPPPVEAKEEKKTEIVRKSTFFSLKRKKKSKVKDSIMSVDKTDDVKLPEVVKRTRVPVRIPEHVIQNTTSTDPNERTPTQEETARRIRKWFLFGRTGEDPKPIVEKKSNDVEINKTSGKESPLPTLEKIHPKDFPTQKGYKKEVKKGVKSKGDVLKAKSGVRVPEKILQPPSGFRTPRKDPPSGYGQPQRILDPVIAPRTPQKVPEAISEPPSEPGTSQRISDPPSEERTKVSDPQNEQRIPEGISEPASEPGIKISEPPSEPKAEILDPPSESRTMERISDPPNEPRPPEKISDPPSQSERISEPPSEPRVKISDPPSEPKPEEKILSEARTKVTHPNRPRTPQKIPDPPSEPRTRPPDPQSEPGTPQKISDPPSEPKTRISDPPSEPRMPQKTSVPPKGPQRVSEQPKTPQRAPRAAPQRNSDPLSVIKSRILDPPRMPQKTLVLSTEPKAPMRILDLPKAPRMPQKRPASPGGYKTPPKISYPPSEPKPVQKFADPPATCEYSVWVPSDETFKKKLADAARTEKVEPKKEAPPPGNIWKVGKYVEPKKSEIKVNRKYELNMKKQTMPFPKKPEMKITKKPERIVKAKAEPARKEVVDAAKPREVAKAERKIERKPEKEQMSVKSLENVNAEVVAAARQESTAAQVVRPKEVVTPERNIAPTIEQYMGVQNLAAEHIVAPAEIELRAAEVARPEELVTPERNIVEHMRIQNLGDVNAEHMVAAARTEPAAEVVTPEQKIVEEQIGLPNLGNVITESAKVEPAIAKAIEVTKSIEVVTPEGKIVYKIEEPKNVQDLGYVNAEPATAALITEPIVDVAKMNEVHPPEPKIEPKLEEQMNMGVENVKASEETVNVKSASELQAKAESASELQAKAAAIYDKVDLPNIEELIKPEEKDLPYPKPVLASSDHSKIENIITVPPPEIAKSVKKDEAEVENDEPEVLKGAINIKLKPLSEIESLTKAVSKPGNLEKVGDVKGSGIDELEKIISKKIETIPCVKPKLPPYYYTPYSSSTVEPEEELPNKKKDKTDEK